MNAWFLILFFLSCLFGQSLAFAEGQGPWASEGGRPGMAAGSGPRRHPGAIKPTKQPFWRGQNGHWRVPGVRTAPVRGDLPGIVRPVIIREQAPVVVPPRPVYYVPATAPVDSGSPLVPSILPMETSPERLGQPLPSAAPAVAPATPAVEPGNPLVPSVMPMEKPAGLIEGSPIPATPPSSEDAELKALYPEWFTSAPRERTGLIMGAYSLQNTPLNHSTWYAGLSFSERYSPTWECSFDLGWDPKTIGGYQYHLFPAMMLVRYYPMRVRWTMPYLTVGGGVVPGLMFGPDTNGNVYSLGLGGKAGAGMEYTFGNLPILSVEAGYVFYQVDFQKDALHTRFTVDGLYVTGGMRF